jgi:hypothetical protein
VVELHRSQSGSQQNYDIAVRDMDMAISAFALGQLSKLRAQSTSEQDGFTLYEKPAA